MKKTILSLELVREASKKATCSKGARVKPADTFEGRHPTYLFDNLPQIMLLSPDWEHATSEPTLVEVKGKGTGYEGLTFQPETRRWYCMIESDKKKSGKFMPRVDVFDEAFGFIESHWLDFPLETPNRFRWTYPELPGNDYLLGLREGNAQEQ
jgi:hypothetical protein